MKELSIEKRIIIKYTDPGNRSYDKITLQYCFNGWTLNICMIYKDMIINSGQDIFKYRYLIKRDEDMSKYQDLILKCENWLLSIDNYFYTETTNIIIGKDSGTNQRYKTPQLKQLFSISNVASLLLATKVDGLSELWLSKGVDVVKFSDLIRKMYG